MGELDRLALRGSVWAPFAVVAVEEQSLALVLVELRGGRLQLATVARGPLGCAARAAGSERSFGLEPSVVVVRR